MSDDNILKLSDQLGRMRRNHAVLDELTRDRRWRSLADSLAEIHDASRKAEEHVNRIIFGDGT